MGDFFELQEMGILDEMGEYIGHGVRYRRRRKNIPRGDNITSKNAKNGVFNWLLQFQPKSGHWEGQNRIIKDYAKYKNWNKSVPNDICMKIQKEFGDFMKWYKRTRNK